MKSVAAAIKWLQSNSINLGPKYKNEWLAISSTGVKFNSKSYTKVAEAAKGQPYIIIKVPKNPQTAYFY